MLDFWPPIPDKKNNSNYRRALLYVKQCCQTIFRYKIVDYAKLYAASHALDAEMSPEKVNFFIVFLFRFFCNLGMKIGHKNFGSILFLLVRQSTHPLVLFWCLFKERLDRALPQGPVIWLWTPSPYCVKKKIEV